MRQTPAKENTSARPGAPLVRAFARAALACLLLVPVCAGLYCEFARERVAGDADHRAGIERAMRAVLTPDHIERSLARHFADEDYEGAALVIEAADMVGAPVAPRWRERYRDETTGWRAAARSAWRCGRGFVTGRGASTSEIACAIGSDLMVVGDVRDVGREAGHFLAGEEVDTLMLGLAGAGLALTAALPLSGGTSLAARGGVALMKAAIRAGVAGASLVKSVAKAVARAVDVSALRRAAGRGAVDLDRLAPLTEAATSLHGVWRAGGPRSVVMAVRAARNLDDLRQGGRVARIFGDRSAAVFHTIGRAAFHIVKTATRWTARGFLLVSGALMSGLGALVSLATAMRVLIGLAGFVVGPSIRLTVRLVGALARALASRAVPMLPARA